ncbi:MAG: MobC family plasmid mobilization relaxosome protein [Bacteroides sp.]|nr:MobC family plasmid mobilization relaxosome protein [Bacteroides sp.]
MFNRKSTASLCIGQTNTVNPDGLKILIPNGMANKLSRAELLRKNRNKEGRPKLSFAQKKDYKVTVKFSGDEYYTLREKVRMAGTTMSEFIRTAVQKSEVKERLNASHLNLILQLTGMANNLNQIARKANAAGYLSAQRDSETLARSIDNLIKSIENDG